MSENFNSTENNEEQLPITPATPAEAWWNGESDGTDYVDVTPEAPMVAVIPQPVYQPPVQPQPQYQQPTYQPPVQPQPQYQQPMYQPPVQPQPQYQQPTYQPPVQPQPQYQQPMYQPPVQPQPQYQQPMYQQPVHPQPQYQQPIYYMPQQPVETGKKSSVVAMIFGILALVLGYVPIVGWAIDAVAVIFGIVSRVKGDKTARSILGIIFGGIGAFVALVYLVSAGALSDVFYI